MNKENSMSYAQVGSCPRCGAPIYAPHIWHAIVPPPNHYTCGCFPQTLSYTTNTLTIGDPRKKQIKNNKQPLPDMAKAVDSLGDALEGVETDPVKKELSDLRSELESTKKLLAKVLEALTDE